jgi:hypothetical protein
MYLHGTPGSTLDLLRLIALELDLEAAHYRGDLGRQISQATVRLHQSKKQHPILICDGAQLLRHAALATFWLENRFFSDSTPAARNNTKQNSPGMFCQGILRLLDCSGVISCDV